jgi:hypothetical protein
MNGFVMVESRRRLIYHQNVINKNLQLAEKNKMFVCVAT